MFMCGVNVRWLAFSFLALSLTSCITVEVVDRRIDPKVVDHNFAVVGKKLERLQAIQTITVKSLGETREKVGLNEKGKK